MSKELKINELYENYAKALSPEFREALMRAFQIYCELGDRITEAYDAAYGKPETHEEVEPHNDAVDNFRSPDTG
jgi:hypothetical protein